MEYQWHIKRKKLIANILQIPLRYIGHTCNT